MRSLQEPFSPPARSREESELPLWRQLQLLRVPFQQALAFYSKTHPDHLYNLLFLVELALFFETHLEANLGKASEERLSFYRMELRDFLESPPRPEDVGDIERLLFFIDILSQDRSSAEIEEFALRWFSQPFLKIDDSYFWRKTRLARKLARLAPLALFRIERHFEDPLVRDRLCTSVLSGLLGKQFDPKELEAHWEGSFPLFRSGSYVLDFAHGTLFHLKLGKLVSIDPALHYETRGMLDHDRIWRADNGVLTALAKGMVFVPGYGGKRDALRNLSIEGQTVLMRVYSALPQELNLPQIPFLTGPSPLSLIHYIPVHNPNCIYSFLKESDTPFVLFELQEKSVRVRRLDAQGAPTDHVLVDLSAIESSSLRYGSASEMLSFVNMRTNELEELHLPWCNLIFKKDESGRLICLSGQLIDHQLLVGEFAHSLNNFAPAMVMRSPKNERVVVVQDKELHLSPEDFSREVYQRPVESAVKLFIYRENWRTGDLELADGMAQNALWHLIYLFKLQREYEKAYRYLRRLDRSIPMDQGAMETFLRFTKLKDSSPESIVFNLKLSLFFLDKFYLMEEGNLKPIHLEEVHREIGRWLWGVYINYLRNTDDERYSRITRDLQLSPDGSEEIRICTLLVDWLKKGNFEVPMLLRARHSILTKADHTLEMTIRPREVSPRPLCYQSLPSPGALNDEGLLTLPADANELPVEGMHLGDRVRAISLDYPIEMTPQGVSLNFVKLYEQARSASRGKPHPFDFVLIAVLGYDRDSHPSLGKSLSYLLFYVRHFPHHFKDLPLEGVEPRITQLANYREVVKRVMALEGSREYREFRQTFLVKTQTFNYSAQFNVVLRIPSYAPIPISMGPSDFRPLRPLSDMTAALLEYREEPLDAGPLIALAASKVSAIQDDLFEAIRTGQKELEEARTTHYRVKNWGPYNLVEYHDSEDARAKSGENNRHPEERVMLLMRRDQLKKRVAELQGEIEVANAPYSLREGCLVQREIDAELHDEHRRDAGQKLTITPENIMKEVLLKNNDIAFFRENAPLLFFEGEEQGIIRCRKIIKATCRYYSALAELLKVRQAIKEYDALKESDRLSQRNLAHLLEIHFTADPLLYPELYYFYVTTGMMPREEQIKIYIEAHQALSRGQNFHFVLPAGGGKTSVMEPLFSLLAKRFGLMPIYFSTTAIYSVDKQNLSRSLGSLEGILSLLEVQMHTELTVEQLQFISSELVRYKKEGRSLIMTPPMYYALYLMYLSSALYEKNPVKVQALATILNFFRKECLQIVDESHRNLSPLTSAILGVGALNQIDEKERDLLFDLMKPLLGLESLGKEEAAAMRFFAKWRSNPSLEPTEEEVRLAHEALARHYAKKLLAGYKGDQADFIRYWSDRRSQTPALFSRLPAEEAQLLIGVGHFLHDLMPQMFKMQPELDHAPSPKEGEEFETPFHRGIPSFAHFFSARLSAILSIRGTFFRGLKAKQLDFVLTQLKEEDKLEQPSVAPGQLTPSNQRFRSWLSGGPLEGLSLKDVALDSREQMAELLTHLQYHPGPVEICLKGRILPQIGLTQEQLTVTVQEFVGGFKGSISFSATPLHRLACPRSIEHFHEDPRFVAEVVANFSRPENQRQIFPESASTFFEHMKRFDPELLERATVYIDCGLFSDLTNREFATRWLSHTHHDGVLFFDEGESGKERVVLLLRDGREFECVGGKIQETLKANHLENLKIASYYDAAHTESADIFQGEGIQAIVFMGDRVALSQAAQAIMRLRGFLDRLRAQTIVWAFERALAEKIAGHSPPKASEAPRAGAIEAPEMASRYDERPVYRDRSDLEHKGQPPSREVAAGPVALRAAAPGRREGAALTPKAGIAASAAAPDRPRAPSTLGSAAMAAASLRPDSTAPTPRLGIAVSAAAPDRTALSALGSGAMAAASPRPASAAPTSGPGSAASAAAPDRPRAPSTLGSGPAAEAVLPRREGAAPTPRPGIAVSAAAPDRTALSALGSGAMAAVSPHPASVAPTSGPGSAAAAALPERPGAPTMRLTADQIFAWLSGNEVRDTHQHIILNAYHEVIFLIRGPVVRWSLDIAEGARAMAYLESHRAGLVDQATLSLLPDHERPLPTQKGLLAYAESTYARFAFRTPLKKQASMVKTIEAISAQAASRVPETASHDHSRLTQNVQRQSRVQRQMKSVAKTTKHTSDNFSNLTPMALGGAISLWNPRYPERSGKLLAREEFSEGLTVRLYIEPNQLQTAMRGGRPLGKSFLKQIDFLLIVIHKDGAGREHIWAEAISNDIVSRYVEELATCPSARALSHQAFVITAQGTLVKWDRGLSNPIRSS